MLFTTNTWYNSIIVKTKKRKKITKAVITAAGYGTRFLPATKNVPKELLPIINKPTISYVVDQCVAAGITEIIIVTRFGNHSVEDYFDSSPALENYLLEKGKDNIVEAMKEIYTQANFIFVRQKQDLPYGNAAPLYSVKELVDDGPFIYAWGDDIILGENAGVAELIKLYKKEGGDAILNCVEKTKEEISKIGAAVKIKDGTVNEVEGIVEKPPVNEVPSNLLSVSPYLLTPKIFDYLDPKKDDKVGEFLFQPAVLKIIEDGGKVLASVSKGTWLTNGDPLNYLKTTVEIALSRNDLHDDFLTYLRNRVNQADSF